MISSILLLGAIVGLGLPAAVIFIPLALLTRNVMPLYHVSMAIVRIGLSLARVEVRTSGLEQVPPATACIFMANHVSNLDPPALLPLIPGRTSVYLKRSLMKIPVLGFAMKLGEFVPVDRKGSVESAQESVAAARRVMAKGIHITTFVEGTRSPDGRMIAFKKGPFYLAKEADAPCIPVSIRGTETIMGKGSLRIRPGVAHIAFHPPMWPHDYATREELLEAVRAAIASGLPEWMRG